MFFSKTSTYALRVLIRMAQEENRSFSASELYHELNIKLRYLRRLMTDLTRQGFIQSTRGRNGGYMLAKSTKSIYLAEIIDAIEGFESFKTCVLGVADCKLSQVCAMHNVWQGVKADMIRTLSTTTLQDVRTQDFVT